MYLLFLPLYLIITLLYLLVNWSSVTYVWHFGRFSGFYNTIRCWKWKILIFCDLPHWFINKYTIYHMTLLHNIGEKTITPQIKFTLHHAFLAGCSSWRQWSYAARHTHPLSSACRWCCCWDTCGWGTRPVIGWRLACWCSQKEAWWGVRCCLGLGRWKGAWMCPEGRWAHRRRCSCSWCWWKGRDTAGGWSTSPWLRHHNPRWHPCSLLLHTPGKYWEKLRYNVNK